MQAFVSVSGDKIERNKKTSIFFVWHWKLNIWNHTQFCLRSTYTSILDDKHNSSPTRINKHFRVVCGLLESRKRRSIVESKPNKRLSIEKYDYCVENCGDKGQALIYIYRHHPMMKRSKVDLNVLTLVYSNKVTWMNAQSLISSNIQLHETIQVFVYTNDTQKLYIYIERKSTAVKRGGLS